MKKVILLITLSLACCFAGAQIDLGVKAGLNISKFKANEILTQDYRINPGATAQFGYHAGAFLRASLFGVFVQPELVFTSISSEYIVEDLRNATEQIAEQQIGRVDVPVIVGAKFGVLRLGLGPVGSVVVTDQSELKDVSGYEDKIRSATLGYQLGAGFDLWKLALDLRYEGNLTRLGDYIDTGTVQEKFDSRVRQLILSLGLRF